jgi:hypothetical protein
MRKKMKTTRTPKQRRNRAPYRNRPQKNSSTGINGVSITYTRGNKGRTVMPVVSVYYRLKGRVHNKRFYIHLYPSKKAAIQAAAKFRRSMEREMASERKTKSRRSNKK